MIDLQTKVKKYENNGIKSGYSMEISRGKYQYH